jgi:protein-disulfide isomerase/uncharacterized membrane protein
MRSAPTRHRVALVIALVGVAVSVFTWHVATQIKSDAGFTSFCNLGGPINCDVVLSSRWGSFLGMSVAAWGAVAFGVGALLALPGALGASAPFADLLLLGLVGGSAGFALVLLAIAVGVLRHACILCLTMDGIIAAWAVTAVPLARQFATTADAPIFARRSTAHAVVLVALLGAGAAATFAALRAPGEASTAAEVEAVDPKFAAAWRRLPVVPMQEVLGDARHAKGPPDAPITIVEFSDFECPACGHAFGDLHDLLARRRDVRLVFRNYPLDASCNESVPQTMHPDACHAAAAAECAGQQDRFWEYHDLLFENQRALDRDSLFRYARDAGLDIPTFRTCLDDPATMDRVKQDVAAGSRLDIVSTPTMFINGRRVQGALDHQYWDLALVLEKDRAAHPGQTTSAGR